MSRRGDAGGIHRLLAALFVLAAAAGAVAQAPVPRLAARVTDLTGTLGPEQETALEQRLAAFEARKGSQIAVVIVATTKPETVEQYAVRAFEQWKIGRKGVDDGVLLLVAKDDRRLRIEVGYGLEGAIPDAVAQRVIDEVIVPRFRAGDLHAGVSAGVDQLIRLIEGEKLPPPAAGSGKRTDFFTFALVAMIVLGSVLNAAFGRRVGAGTVGFVAGAATWYLVGLTAAVLAAAVAFILALVIFGLRGRHAVGRGGGWSSGGSSGGGWSSGGGGFSGGGGSSGGGGASGSW